MSIYSRYGVKKVINAAFHLTRLGGSTLSPAVLEAMEDANNYYCSMWELIEKGSKHIADMICAPGAWITSGAFNALVLGAAACMAGKDTEKMRRLPNTEGMKNEFIIQRNARLYVYDRSMEVAGGKFVFVGDERWGATTENIENAINEKTAGIHYAYPTSPNPYICSLETSWLWEESMLVDQIVQDSLMVGKTSSKLLHSIVSLELRQGLMIKQVFIEA
jgi:seryl-tRNA(Sec) selenium transferase